MLKTDLLSGTAANSVPVSTRFVSDVEASQITGLAVATLRSRRVRGGGPPYSKVGRRVLYDLEELIAWMRERRAVSTADAARQELARAATEEHARAVGAQPPRRADQHKDAARPHELGEVGPGVPSKRGRGRPRNRDPAPPRAQPSRERDNPTSRAAVSAAPNQTGDQ